MNTDFHGIFAKTEALRNFVEVAVFQETKADSDGLIFGKRVDSLQDELLSLKQIDVDFPGVFQADDGLHWFPELSLFAANLFETGVSRDSAEPADDGLGFAKLCHGSKCFHDRDLDEVFGGRMIADIGVGDGIEHAIVGFDDFAQPLSHEDRGDAFGAGLGNEPSLDAFGGVPSFLQRGESRVHEVIRGSRKRAWRFERDSKQGDG